VQGSPQSMYVVGNGTSLTRTTSLHTLALLDEVQRLWTMSARFLVIVSVSALSEGRTKGIMIACSNGKAEYALTRYREIFECKPV